MQNKEKGVSLIIVFFVMVIMIAVVLSVSALLYSEIKIIRNMNTSVVSFYIADSGVEKVLYYDRQVRSPVNGERGLCLMCDEDSRSCPAEETDENLKGLACTCSANVGPYCDPNKCEDCTVKFSTAFLSLDGEPFEYSIEAKSSTIDIEDGLGSNDYFQLDSRGLYNDISRAIHVVNIGEKVSP